MNKTVTPAQIRTIHQFLLDIPHDSLPNINHGLFAVLALIEDELTERQIIAALDGRVGRSTVFAHLTLASSQGWIRLKNMEDDRKWFIQFLGKQLLDSYLLIMKKGICRL